MSNYSRLLSLESGTKDKEKVVRCDTWVNVKAADGVGSEAAGSLKLFPVGNRFSVRAA